MFRAITVVSLLVLGILAITPGYAASCWIEDAAVAEGSLWLLCQDGKLLVSSDPSQGWEERDLPSRELLRAIAFTGKRGFVAGDEGTLLRTVDGGKSWVEIDPPVTENLRAVYALGDNVWAAGWSGVILYSSDAGASWSRQITPISLGFESIYFTDENHGWAVGWVGAILRTEDGGRTWLEPEAQAAKWSLNSVYFRDARIGWAVGFNGQILHTNDGGRTWEGQQNSEWGTLTSVYVEDETHGWITTADGLLATTDGGESWQPVAFEERLFLSGLVPFHGSLWAIGPVGILKQSGEALAWERMANPARSIPALASS